MRIQSLQNEDPKPPEVVASIIFPTLDSSYIHIRSLYEISPNSVTVNHTLSKHKRLLRGEIMCLQTTPHSIFFTTKEFSKALY